MPKPLDVLNASAHPWKRHRQLADLLKRLVADLPDDRFPTMRDVVAELRALEEPERVLAKYAYRTWVQPRGVAFSKAFYDEFFRRDKTAHEIFRLKMPSGETGAPLPSTQHHDKLMASLVAVLNYRRGSDPTSIEHLLPRHRGLDFNGTQLHNFRESFIYTLEDCIDSRPPDLSAPDTRDIADAWRKLFEPVLDALASELQITDWPPPGPALPAVMLN